LMCICLVSVHAVFHLWSYLRKFALVIFQLCKFGCLFQLERLQKKRWTGANLSCANATHD
jgi:hypothetical protein